MKILVIGAGWYGCHLAITLKSEGHDITVVDKRNSIFTGSSSHNQNRLHLGFHYPRSSDTIKECQDGYPRFMDKYGFATCDISANIYFVSDKDSLISSEDFLHTFRNHIYSTIDLSDAPLPIHGVSPGVVVEERFINSKIAALFFKENLSLSVISDITKFNSINSIQEHLNTHYDLILNCTYNQLAPIDYEYFELFVTLLYKINTPYLFAYTIMDGPFFSIYPYDISNNIYTITHVKHCILYKGKSCVPDVDTIMTQLDERRRLVEESICSYIPSWNTIATYTGYFTSWKTKHDVVKDDRSVRWKKDGNIVHIYGGKITGIFEAERLVRSIIEKECIS
jgi:hypothetical protein